MTKEHILVVEDGFVTGANIQAKLEEMGYEVPFVADPGEVAIKKTDEERAGPCPDGYPPQGPDHRYRSCRGNS